MAYTYFLAQVMGLWLALFGLAVIINPDKFRKIAKDFLGNMALTMFSGGISILIGLLLVLTHNIWIANWDVVITIVSWVILIHGVIRLFFPDILKQTVEGKKGRGPVLFISWVMFIVGLFLIYRGFFF